MTGLEMVLAPAEPYSRGPVQLQAMINGFSQPSKNPMWVQVPSERDIKAA
jgi:hypothetical protein